MHFANRKVFEGSSLFPNFEGFSAHALDWRIGKISEVLVAGIVT
jgi:hypothetical protein